MRFLSSTTCFVLASLVVAMTMSTSMVAAAPKAVTTTTVESGHKPTAVPGPATVSAPGGGVDPTGSGALPSPTSPGVVVPPVVPTSAVIGTTVVVSPTGSAATPSSTTKPSSASSLGSQSSALVAVAGVALAVAIGF